MSSLITITELTPLGEAWNQSIELLEITTTHGTVEFAIEDHQCEIGPAAGLGETSGNRRLGIPPEGALSIEARAFQ